MKKIINKRRRNSDPDKGVEIDITSGFVILIVLLGIMAIIATFRAEKQNQIPSLQTQEESRR